MSVSVELKTCFATEGIQSGEMALPLGVKTVKDLLVFMGRDTAFGFFDEKTGLPHKDIEVLLNGKDIWFYPLGPATALGDGDVLEVYPLALGGG